MGKLIVAVLLIVGGIAVGRTLAAMAGQMRSVGRWPIPWVTIGRAVQNKERGCAHWTAFDGTWNNAHRPQRRHIRQSCR